MSTRPVLAAAFVVACAGAVAAYHWPAAAQTPARIAKSPAMELDAGPESGGPDPLTPAEMERPPPSAPGAPAAVPTAKPGDAVDPIVQAARQALASPIKGSAAEKEDYAALADFYAGIAAPVFVDAAGGFTVRGTQAIEEIRKAEDWGLRAQAFELPQPIAADATPEARAQAEIKIGMAVLTYARHARGGRVEPVSVSRLFDQKPTIYEPKTLIRAIAVSDSVDAYLRDLHPKHAGFHNLRKALLLARGAKTAEPAPPAVTIPAGPSIKPGQDHPHVALVRTRLAVEAANGKDTLYDDGLVVAVKAFQRLRSLDSTGIINAATRNAMNDAGRPSASADNIRRIVVNMERWRWLPVELGEFYVWDSVTEQMTSIYHDGKQVLSERIVVGKANTPTVMFSADMLFVIFHPSWGVPPGMKNYELGPQLRNTGGGWFSSNPLASQILAGHGLKVSRGGVPVDPDSVDWSAANIGSYDFVQGPGPRNVLGMVKFRFPNKHDIYMHDTPERHLFGGAVRAFSHGCMRVQNPIKFAEVVLGYDKGWSADKVGEYAKRGGEIKLEKRVPVHITYFTASADEDGKVQFFADLYGLDGRVATAIEGQNVRIAGVAPPTGSLPGAAATEEKPERPRTGPRASRKKQKEENFNPFSAIFGN